MCPFQKLLQSHRHGRRPFQIEFLPLQLLCCPAAASGVDSVVDVAAAVALEISVAVAAVVRTAHS